MKLIEHKKVGHNAGYFIIGEIISYTHKTGWKFIGEWEEKIIAIERCTQLSGNHSCMETNHCTGQILITDAKRPYGRSTTRWCGIESDFLTGGLNETN